MAKRRGPREKTFGDMLRELAHAERSRMASYQRMKSAAPQYVTWRVGGVAVFAEGEDIPYAELLAEVHWTDEAAERIRADEFRYISPEFNLDTTDVRSGDSMGAVLLAIGLVTRPFLKGMRKVEDPDEDNVSVVQVFRTGVWHHEWYGKITITPETLVEMVENHGAYFSSDGSPHDATEMVVDYNHMSLFGGPDDGKAAGWVRGRGIYVEEEQTQPVAVAAGEPDPAKPNGGARMNEQRIRAILQLADDVAVTDDHRNAALDALDARLSELDSAAGTDGDGEAATDPETPDTAGGPDVSAALAGAMAAAEEGREALKRIKAREADDAVSRAFAAGKLTGAQVPWAKKQAMADPEGFAQFVESAPVVVDTTRSGTNSDSEAGADAVAQFVQEKCAAGVSMSDAQVMALKQFGQEAFAEYRKPRR